MVFNGYIRIDHWNNKLFFLLTVWDLPMAGLHIVVLLTRITIFIFVATEMGWWNWLIWSLEICWCRQQGASVMAGMDQEFSPVGRTSRMPRMGHTFNGSLPAIMAFQAFHGWMDNMNGNGGDAVHGWQEANSAGYDCGDAWDHLSMIGSRKGSNDGEKCYCWDHDQFSLMFGKWATWVWVKGLQSRQSRRLAGPDTQPFLSGWWFGFFSFLHILGIIIPTDFYIFQRGGWNSKGHSMIWAIQ